MVSHVSGPSASWPTARCEVTLQSAIEQEIGFLRAEAEALMPDEFEVGTYGDGWHYNAEAGEDVRDFEALFTTPGKVMTSTAAGEVEVGGRTAIEINRTLHIPVGTPDVPVGAVARRTGRPDLRVLAEVTHPQPKSRRFAVEEVLT
jgi:hypothetical protein